jgi:hypothetical protein
MESFDYINKIKKNLRDLKEFLAMPLILETDEKIDDKFEKYNELIKAKIKLFKLIEKYFPEQYYEFKKIKIQYILFSKKNLEEIKSKFLYFYNSFLSLIKEHLKIEKIQFYNEEDEKNETENKEIKYNVLKDVEENIWDDSCENLIQIFYEAKSDTTNKYDPTLNFDNSSSYSNKNDF